MADSVSWISTETLGRCTLEDSTELLLRLVETFDQKEFTVRKWVPAIFHLVVVPVNKQAVNA